MKINFIVNENDYNSTIDSNILSFLFKKIKDTTDIKIVNVNNFKCENASINYFLGTTNSLLIKYAKCNILIPNNHTFKKQDLVFLDTFDYILCKSKYVYTLLEQYVSKDKIKYISWRSTDLNNNNNEKDYNSVLLYCYNNNYTQYNTIIETWKAHYPILHVINYKNIKISENIEYHSNISQTDFEKLFNNCGFHLCLNEVDSFSHNINQCALTKSIPIIINGAPMNEIIDKDNLYCIPGKKKKLVKYIGNKISLSIDCLHNTIESILKINDNSLFENMGIRCRSDALKNHSVNDTLFKETIKHIFSNVRNTPKNIPDEIDEYPTVSIVTLTHNRPSFFNLSIYNYNTTDYPKDKIEWVVYDTSNDGETVEKFLPPQDEQCKKHINYIHDNTKMSIGETRNKAVENCKHEIILFQDDDDYYFPNNIKKRVEELVRSKKKIVGCTILGCFNINKCISFIESKIIDNNIEDKISIATLGFYKSVWVKTKFNDENINEADSLITQNLSEFKEISWEDIIVSLVHKYNITHRTTPVSKPNGNHYGFSKGLFKYLLELQNIR